MNLEHRLRGVILENEGSREDIYRDVLEALSIKDHDDAREYLNLIKKWVNEHLEIDDDESAFLFAIKSYLN